MFETIFRRIFRLVFELFKGKGLGKIPGLSKIFSYLVLRLCNGKLYGKIDDQKYCYIVSSGRRLLYYYWHNHEPLVSSSFRSMVKEGWTVVDLGASFGRYTLLFSRLVGETGLVLSFEPDPLSFEGLMENIEINKLKNVRPFQLAASDSIGEREMEGGRGFGDKGKHMVTVKTVPLDSFLNINEIDFIRMDIEGAELEALRGMEKILAKGKSKIICECHPNKLLSLGYKTEDIESILKRYGYNIYLISERGLIFKNTLSKKRAHYLFSKESYHEKSFGNI